MPEAIVDVLEVVQVYEKHGAGAVAPFSSRKRLADELHEAAAVEHISQRVMAGLAAQLALQLHSRGDIPEAPHPADDAIAQAVRCRVPLDHWAVLELQDVQRVGLWVVPEVVH